MDYRLGDALSLPFGDEEFDVAVMALVIGYLPDRAKAMAEMKRVVRPGHRAAWNGTGHEKVSSRYRIWASSTYLGGFWPMTVTVPCFRTSSKLVGWNPDCLGKSTPNWAKCVPCPIGAQRLPAF